MNFQLRSRRLLGILIALLVVLFLVFQVAVHGLKGRIEQALGPSGEIREMRVGLGGVEILGLRLPALSGGKPAWPAADLLRAERVLVVPSLLDLFSARIVVRSIRIEGAYLSMLRTTDQKLHVLPGLTDRPAKPADSGPQISIGHIELVDSAIEYFDASVSRPALKIRLEQIALSLDDLHLSDLLGQSRLQVSGVLKGPHHDGRLEIIGRTEFASKESDIKARLDDVDLLALKPYLIRAADTGVKRGSMDLEIHSVVAKGRLNAPGMLTLHDLELSSNGSFMGVPQAAAVALMKSREGAIQIQFTLDGDINDPRFSLNEQMLIRIGAGLAESLGISLEGLTRGVGGAGGNVVRGLGETFGKLLGQ
ncbi:DUF748 domain-containing protein [Ferribacterium limneticum]|uniref:DUF748 domain-containing protein n=1 Tax=Ferribacterium limneticum TaxID=76259 RepID=UPI001CFC0220|nr:DUF748 domain-containing protein [Ferribacterium limneticum]UCV18447.1 DUF748 domain-containing protein [Ferribacterium limneticum]